MNILFITKHSFLPQTVGGMQSSANQLCQALLTRGHKVAVLSGFRAEGPLGFVGRLKMKINTLLLHRKISVDTRLGYHVWRGWFPWEDIGFVAKRENADLIVVLAGEPVKMGLAAQKTGLPVLIKIQDVDFQHHGGNFKELGDVPCIANSNFAAGRYHDAFGVNPTAITPFMALDSYKTQTTRENVTFINPYQEKGGDVALEIARRCPEIPFTFVEAWPLPPERRDYVLKQMETLPNVTLLPAQKDMRSVYGKAKILLAPSLWEEAYGRVATEAQVSGIPVVASDRGGLPEAVGKGGLLLDPDGPVGPWVEAIRKLWSDEGYYARMSALATENANRPELSYDFKLRALERELAAALKHGAAHG